MKKTHIQREPDRQGTKGKRRRPQCRRYIAGTGHRQEHVLLLVKKIRRHGERGTETPEGT